MAWKLAATIVIGLFAAMLGGCVPGTGVAYEAAVERTRARLQRGSPRELFAVREVEGRGKTQFRFISGDKRDKAAHAFPRKVGVEVISKSGGVDSYLTVEARRKLLLIHRDERSLAGSWRATLLEAIETSTPLR